MNEMVFCFIIIYMKNTKTMTREERERKNEKI